jgi:hypothetical protein
LLGAADMQIVVKRDASDNIVATVELAKDGPIGLEFVSRLVVVDLGLDDDGDAITSCIVEPVGEPSLKVIKDAPRLTPTAKIALRALHAAVGELGEPRPSSHIPTGTRAVTIDQWRDYAFKIGISSSDNKHGKGAAFNRASERLVAASKIGVWDTYVWPV